MLHGDADMVVPLDFGKDGFARIKALGVADLNMKVYKGMGHTADPRELRDALAFLTRVLPPVAPTKDAGVASGGGGGAASGSGTAPGSGGDGSAVGGGAGS